MELRVVFVSLCIAAASATHYHGVKGGAAAQSGAFAGSLTLPGLPDLTQGLAGVGTGSLSSSSSFAQSSASSYAASNSGSFSYGGPGKVEGGSPVGSGAVANTAAFAGAGSVAGAAGQPSPGYSSIKVPSCNGNCPSNPQSGPVCHGDSCGYNPVPSKCSQGSCDNGSTPSTAQGYNNSPSKTDTPKDDGLLGYVALEEDDRPGKIESSNGGYRPVQYDVAAGTKSPQFGKPCSSAACGQPHSSEPAAGCTGPDCGSGPSCSTPGGCSQHNSVSTTSANAGTFAGASAGGLGGAPQGSPENTRTPIFNSEAGYSSGIQFSGSFGGAPGILKPNDYSVPEKQLSPNYPQHSTSYGTVGSVSPSGSHLGSVSPQPIPQTPPIAQGPLYSGPSSYVPHGQKPQHDIPAGLPATPASASSSYGHKPHHSSPAAGSSFSSSGAFAGAAAGAYTGSFGGPPGILKPNDYSFHGKPLKPHGPSYGKPSYQPIPSVPSGPPYQGSFGGASGVVSPNGPIGTGSFPSGQPDKPSFGCSGGLTCDGPSRPINSQFGHGCGVSGCNSNSDSFHGSFGGPPGILKPAGPSSYPEKPDYSAKPGCIGGSSCGGHGGPNEGPVIVSQAQGNCGEAGCSNNNPYQGDFSGSPVNVRPIGHEESGSFYSSQHSKPINGYHAEGSPNQGGYGGTLNSATPSGVSGAGTFAAASASASAASHSGAAGYGGPAGAQGSQGSGGYNGGYGVKGGYNRPNIKDCEGGCGGGDGAYGGGGAGAAAGSASFGLSLGGAGPGPILGAAREVAHSFHDLGHNIGKNIGGLLLGGAGAGGGGLAVSGSYASSGAKSYDY